MVTHLWVRFVIKLLRSDPSTDQMITHGVRQSEIVVSWSGYISVFHQSKMQVPIESFLDLGDILYSDDSSNADLFAFFLVSERGRHGAILSSYFRSGVWSL